MARPSLDHQHGRLHGAAEQSSMIASEYGILNRNESNTMQQELIDLLAARGGHFRLESGHHGDLWLDLDSLFLRPTRLRGILDDLAGQLSGDELDAICGPMAGGAFVAQTIANHLDLEFYYSVQVAPAQSDILYSAQYRIPDALRSRVRGKRVAIVDDVVNAGSAVRATYGDLKICGARVAVIGALLALGSSVSSFASEQQVALKSTAHLANRLWVPSECPLCRARVPLESLA
jgi:orotate phosphoribosyltransferase